MAAREDQRYKKKVLGRNRLNFDYMGKMVQQACFIIKTFPVSREFPTREMNRNEKRFVVLGKTGNGKSATVNTILGKDECYSTLSGKSVTKKCKKVVTSFEGKTLLIVDTPGLCDADLNEEETLNEIGKVMGLTTPGFHAFIIVFMVGRFTTEEMNTVDMLEQKFGRELYKRAVLLFTKVDDLVSMTFEKYLEIEIGKELKRLIVKCKGRTVGFNNKLKGEGRITQVRELMVQIQNIMEDNENTYYTDDIYKAIEQQLADEIHRRREEDNSATDDAERAEILNEIEEETGYWGRFRKWFKGTFNCIIL